MRYKFRACQPEMAIKVANDQRDKYNNGNLRSVIILRPDHDRDQVLLYAPSRAILRDYIAMYQAQDKAMGPAISEENFLAWDQQDFTGVRFYAEYASTTEKNRDVAHSPQRALPVLQHTQGTVVAVWYDQGEYGRYPAIVSIIEKPNCDAFSFSEVTSEYLSERCKAISREQAMRLHPELFLTRYFNAD